MRTDPEPLSNRRERPEQLWRGLVLWFETISANIDRDLLIQTGLTGTELQVLAALSATPDGSLNQLQLREDLHWSPSRLSHQLRRMRDRGYCAASQTGHGTRMRVTLTPNGARAYAAAQNIYDTAIRTHLLDELTPEHRLELGRAIARIQSHEPT